jgi:hypothetical protein
MSFNANEAVGLFRHTAPATSADAPNPGLSVVYLGASVCEVQWATPLAGAVTTSGVRIAGPKRAGRWYGRGLPTQITGLNEARGGLPFLLPFTPPPDTVLYCSISLAIPDGLPVLATCSFNTGPP